MQAVGVVQHTVNLVEVSGILHKGEPDHSNKPFNIKALFCIKIHISAEFTLKPL